MKNKIIVRIVTVCMATVLVMAPVNAYASALLKVGSRGTEVTLAQATLQKMGYFTYPTATGYFGKITESAVKSFQRANGIAADGVIGKITRGILYSDSTATSESNAAIKLLSVDSSSDENGDLDWFTQVRDIWKRGMVAVITDVDTGKSFQVERTYGTNHADVEALTKKDTQTIKEIWGGFSWERRAVVVKIGQQILAGSMTAMPHAGLDSKSEGSYISGRSAGYGYGYNYDAIKGNGMDGHMDIHFKNSRTHGTNVVQKSQQDMVKKAAEYIAKMY